jgi:hypothetical protein
MFDTTYWGVVHGSLAALRHYRRRFGPGAIVNVGSFFGDRAPPVQGTYASAKFAVHGFTDAMRQEIEHEGWPISVSLIHPGRIDTPYNEHAGNHMPMQPVHRGMVYAPEAVADAILWCAAHPKRDMYVGSQAKAAALIGNIAPRLTDMLLERIMYSSQQSRTRRFSGAPERALFEAGYGGQERGTHEPQLRRGRSLYVQATKRPELTLALLGAAAVLAGRRHFAQRCPAAPDAGDAPARAAACRPGGAGPGPHVQRCPWSRRPDRARCPGNRPRRRARPPRRARSPRSSRRPRPCARRRWEPRRAWRRDRGTETRRARVRPAARMAGRAKAPRRSCGEAKPRGCTAAGA